MFDEISKKPIPRYCAWCDAEANAYAYLKLKEM